MKSNSVKYISVIKSVHCYKAWCTLKCMHGNAKWIQTSVSFTICICVPQRVDRMQASADRRILIPTESSSRARAFRSSLHKWKQLFSIYFDFMRFAASNKDDSCVLYFVHLQTHAVLFRLQTCHVYRYLHAP